MPWSRAPKNRESGAAAVEFALVVPILIALVIGIISYGYMMSFRQGISQGAAEGARAAAVAPLNLTAVQKQDAAVSALNEALNGYGISCSSGALVHDGTTVGSCGVSIAKCVNSANDCASVSVDYAYRDHPLLPSFPGLGVTLPDRLEYTAVSEVSK